MRVYIYILNNDQKKGFHAVTHMICEISGGSWKVVKVRLADVSLLYDQIDGHLSFQAADVAVAEVITELMDLPRPSSHLANTTRLKYWIKNLFSLSHVRMNLYLF